MQKNEKKIANRTNKAITKVKETTNNNTIEE